MISSSDHVVATAVLDNVDPREFARASAPLGRTGMGVPLEGSRDLRRSTRASGTASRSCSLAARDGPPGQRRHPLLRHGRLLPDSLGGMLAQVDVAVDVMVVDDASTDGGADVAAVLGAADGRLRVTPHRTDLDASRVQRAA